MATRNVWHRPIRHVSASSTAHAAGRHLSSPNVFGCVGKQIALPRYAPASAVCAWRSKTSVTAPYRHLWKPAVRSALTAHAGWWQIDTARVVGLKMGLFCRSEDDRSQARDEHVHVEPMRVRRQPYCCENGNVFRSWNSACSPSAPHELYALFRHPQSSCSCLTQWVVSFADVGKHAHEVGHQQPHDTKVQNLQHEGEHQQRGTQ